MKKSDAKKKTRASKNSDKQRKHHKRVVNDQTLRETKSQYLKDKEERKVLGVVDRDINDERIKDKIKHNLKVLKALEKEYDLEQAAKKKVNADLEEKGLLTLEEKMKYLSELAAEQQAEAAEFSDENPAAEEEVPLADFIYDATIAQKT